MDDKFKNNPLVPEQFKNRTGFPMLPKEAIEEYKKIYKLHFAVDLSDEEASFRANNLIWLYKITLG